MFVIGLYQDGEINNGQNCYQEKLGNEGTKTGKKKVTRGERMCKKSFLQGICTLHTTILLTHALRT